MSIVDHPRHIGPGHIGNGPLAFLDASHDRHGHFRSHAHEASGQEEGIDILRLFRHVVHYRWLLVAMAAIGLVGALVATMMMTPRYRATARLEVLVPPAKIFRDMEVTSERSDIRSYLTAREKLRSRALAERVVLDLGLGERADFLTPRGGLLPANILNWAFGASNREDIPGYSGEERARLAVEKVLANLSVEPIANTNLLSITYSDPQPEYAYQVANQVARSFIDQRVDQAGDTSSQARKFIQEQVLQAKGRLQKSEEALVDYARGAGITITGGDDSLIAANLTEINRALALAIQESLDYGRLVRQIDSGHGASLEQVLGSEGLEKLRGRLAELKAEYRQKLTLFKPGFPEMQQLGAQIREIESQLKQGIGAITEAIRIKHGETLAKVDDLRNKLSELEAEQAAYQDKNIQYTILKREVDSDRSQYESLIAKLNEVAVGSELRSRNAAIVDMAVLPRTPYAPRLPVNLAMGLVLSLLTGTAAIYILELLDSGFSDPEQVETELQLPVLGVVPAVDERDFRQAMADPRSSLSEGYRSLRASLLFSGARGAPGVLLVTSCEASEGKSTTACKLANDFGALGAKVLLVDADLRRPVMHRLFKLDNAVGLGNMLTNTVRRGDLPRLIRQVSANVSVMTAGTPPPNPADLLSSPRMRLLLPRLANGYDIVVIDAPPIAGLSDASILGRVADATLLVVSANHVTRKAACTALRRIRTAGANVLGVAFTKVSARKPVYRHVYKYLSRDAYGYGGRMAGDEAAALSPARSGQHLGHPAWRVRQEV
ncbi:GumC family protein [Aquamicrobium terrae]